MSSCLGWFPAKRLRRRSSPPRLMRPKTAAAGGRGFSSITTRTRSQVLHRLLVEPNIVEAAQDIFGLPPRVYYGMLAVVPAHGGNGLPWHQDNQYNHVLPAALNTFIALSEITPDKAILWVAPQSHRQGVQPSNENQTTAKGHREAAVEPTNGIPLPTMQPGDVCIFDRSTYHRSLKNQSDSDRYAYAAQYITDNGRYAETCERSPLWIRAADLSERWRFAGLL